MTTDELMRRAEYWTSRYERTRSPVAEEAMYRCWGMIAELARIYRTVLAPLEEASS